MQYAGLSEVIRYEEELKRIMQQTDNHILQARRDRAALDQLNSLIQEEDILVKYLEVQSSKMTPEVHRLYAKNMTRFKKKIKEHKEYVNSYYGTGAAQPRHDPFRVAEGMRIEQQNAQLVSHKVAMYENQYMQNNAGRALIEQGHMLEQNIERNRQIREEADTASKTITLIQRAIFKRKIMFYSLFIILGLVLLFIVFRKLTKEN